LVTCLNATLDQKLPCRKVKYKMFVCLATLCSCTFSKMYHTKMFLRVHREHFDMIYKSYSICCNLTMMKRLRDAQRLEVDQNIPFVEFDWIQSHINIIASFFAISKCLSFKIMHIFASKQATKRAMDSPTCGILWEKRQMKEMNYYWSRTKRTDSI
jgi:hypothetical protein